MSAGEPTAPGGSNRAAKLRLIFALGLLGTLILPVVFNEVLRPLTAVTPRHPVELQFVWSRGAAVEVLRGYELRPVVLDRYLLLDTVFPVFYGCFLYALASLTARNHPRPGWERWGRLLAGVAAVAVAADWLENAFTLAVFSDLDGFAAWLPPGLAAIALIKWLAVAATLGGSIILLLGRAVPPSNARAINTGA